MKDFKFQTNTSGKAVMVGVIILIVGFLSSCKEDEVENPDEGFSNAIKNFVPDSTISKLRDMGMTINEGKEPPLIEGVYHMSPRVMVATTVPGDIDGLGYEVGERISDYRCYFKDQDIENLTIGLDTKEININNGQVFALSEGNGTFLSGYDNTFTAFIELDYTVFYAGDTLHSKTLEVISGKISDSGIEDFQQALMMLNDNGDPYDQFIPNNTGRLFYDEDGLAGTLSSFRIANEKKGEVNDDVRPAFFGR